uniref:hypothetical protein n=1 Tax=Providencia alcalifaciens TaxID=126385 RepID=UPI003A4DFC31
MFPINANRLTVSQSTEFPASSNTSHLPERIKSIQNISELSPHLTETKPVKRNRLKLKLNIEAATQATAFDKLAEKTRLLDLFLVGFFMAAAAKFASEDDDSCRYYPVKCEQWKLTLGHRNG